MRKDRKEYKILLVEDNPGDVLLIEDYLEDHIQNPEILLARTCKQATEIISKNVSSLDIILLDLSLPDNNGEDLIQEILGKSQNIPVIILTGYSDMDFSIKSLNMGVSDYLLKDALNSFSLYKSILHNISRKKFILALQESERRYNELFHFSPQPMWVVDHHNQKILDVNNAAVGLYGISLKDFIGMSFNQLTPENLRLKHGDILDQLPANFSGYLGDFKHITANKNIIDVEVHLSPFVFSEKEAYIIQANDISDRLQYIKAIENQNEKLSKIAWIQSHVVRAPLARMQGLINLLKESPDADIGEQTFYLDQIVNSAVELDKIIRDISNKATLDQTTKN